MGNNGHDIVSYIPSNDTGVVNPNTLMDLRLSELA